MIMLKYPSRSNLNCLFVVLRGLGRGCRILWPILDCRHPRDREDHYHWWKIVDSNHSREDLIYSQAIVSERLLLSNLIYSIPHDRTLSGCGLYLIGLEPMTYRLPPIVLPTTTKGWINLYLERESNPRPFHVKEIRSRYAIEVKCMFLNFPLINIQTKCILYREMVTLHSKVGYEPSSVLDLSAFWWT